MGASPCGVRLGWIYRVGPFAAAFYFTELTCSISLDVAINDDKEKGRGQRSTEDV